MVHAVDKYCMDHFADNWLQFRVDCDKSIAWSFSESAESRIRLEHPSWNLPTLIQHRDEFVSRMDFGRNLFVALSGGVDSQAACLLLKRVKKPFIAAIMRFENNFNQDDVQSAVSFCNLHDISYVLIDISILDFLNTQLPEYVGKYECPSPQLTAHMLLMEKLKDDYAATSIVVGGNPPYMVFEDELGFMSTRSQSAWIKFREIHDFPLYGNFLGYSLDIALPLMLTSFEPNLSGYMMKLRGMYMTGLQVIPQKTKLTGFEQIKKHYEHLTGDVLAFEKAFRYRFQRIVSEYQSTLNVSEDVKAILINNQQVIGVS